MVLHKVQGIFFAAIVRGYGNTLKKQYIRIFMDILYRNIYIYIMYIPSIGDTYMVQAMIDISKEANQILNIVKAKNNLKDKSKAIEKVVLEYGAEILEPMLKPEFIEKMKKRQLEPAVKVDNFKKHFGLN